MLIGFTGLKGSGKDTAAGVLALHYNFEILKFMGPMKAMLNAYLEHVGVPTRKRADMLEGPLKEVKDPVLGGRTPRYAMQTIGTEWGREMMRDTFWVDAFKASVLARHGRITVSDVRFPNEVQAIKELGGIVVRITRAGLEAEAHPSELLINDLPVDFELSNDATISDFQNKVRHWFQGKVDR